MPLPDPLQFFGEAQAATYDERFANLAPLRQAQDLLARAVLSALPDDARILCVGAGTGAEALSLGAAFPRWRFMAVEPSGPMLASGISNEGQSETAGAASVHKRKNRLGWRPAG